jgi:hypothetical protein
VLTGTGEAAEGGDGGAGDDDDPDGEEDEEELCQCCATAFDDDEKEEEADDDADSAAAAAAAAARASASATAGGTRETGCGKGFPSATHLRQTTSSCMVGRLLGSSVSMRSINEQSSSLYLHPKELRLLSGCLALLLIFCR